MDEDNLNIEIRKFLKKVGITSQREIEKKFYSAEKNGEFKPGEEIDIEMLLKIDKFNMSYKIEGKIKVD